MYTIEKINQYRNLYKEVQCIKNYTCSVTGMTFIKNKYYKIANVLSTISSNAYLIMLECIQTLDFVVISSSKFHQYFILSSRESKIINILCTQ